MARGRPKAELVLSAGQREQLESLANSRSLPAGLVMRARIILLSAAGKTNQQIARQLRLSSAPVGKWRRRFLEQDVAGLHDELRPGRPRPIGDERVAQLVRKTLETKPKDGTHWSVRQMAEQTRLSKSTVHRIWQAFGLEPHRQRHFKLSTDPFFVEKVRDIVGLYLNPPDNAVVLCVDEKSQIQALERSQPMLPMGLGYMEGVTHDYLRHRTTTLFAAPDTAKGTVLSEPCPDGSVGGIVEHEPFHPCILCVLCPLIGAEGRKLLQETSTFAIQETPYTLRFREGSDLAEWVHAGNMTADCRVEISAVDRNHIIDLRCRSL